MVGVVEHGDVTGAGVGAREPEREIVRLAAGVDEEDDAQRVGQRRGQAAGVADDRVVQVARVRVELRHLLGGRAHHARVGVPDVADVVDHVEVGPPVLGVQVRALAADDLQRAGVGPTPLPMSAGAYGRFRGRAPR